MRTKFGATILTVVFLSSAAIPRAAAAPQGTVESDLKKTYKITTVQSDSTGLAVTEAGTVLVIKKGGIRSYPPGDAVVLPNAYKDGAMKTAAAKSLGTAGKLGGHFGIPKAPDTQDNSRLLPLNEKVYFTKISVDAQKDIVHVYVVECDTCNSVQQPSNFKAWVDFQFPKGYISGGADAGQIADMISQVFANDTGGDANAQQGNGDQQQAAAAPAAQDPPKQPQSIEKGQTEDQVIAAFGQPDKVVNLGAKKLYIYKDMKVTFIGGKVADVQ